MHNYRNEWPMNNNNNNNEKCIGMSLVEEKLKEKKARVWWKRKQAQDKLCYGASTVELHSSTIRRN